MRILSIDPSGTGTTGIFFKGGFEEQFISYQGLDWKKHYKFIAGMVRVYHPDILLYETTNFISLRGKDMTSLLKLLGTMETLSLPCSTTRPRTETIPVDQVKRLKTQLLKGDKQVEGITYQPGRGKGWNHKGKSISVHGLDAYLIYWLWKEQEQEKPRLKGLGEIKVERSYKDHD